MENTELIATIRHTLNLQNIKEADMPSFDNSVIVRFFYELYSTYPEAYDECLWQSVSDPTRVDYSKVKPNGYYTRVTTTIGRWLKCKDPTLCDSEIKVFSERYKSLNIDASWLKLDTCIGSDEICRIYEDKHICDSCMSNETSVEVYDTADIEVVYAIYEGVVVGRAVCNRKTRQFVRAYPTVVGHTRSHEGLGRNMWRMLFLSLLEREEYTHNTECLLNCRLRYIGGDHDEVCNTDIRIKMPYLDGDYSYVSWNHGNEFAIVTNETANTYRCDTSNGHSEYHSGTLRPGYVIIGGDWHSESDTCYSRYNNGQILASCSCYSNHDDDYFYVCQTREVLLFNRSRCVGALEIVHEFHPTVPVDGLKYPILCDELPKWLKAGFVKYHAGFMKYHDGFYFYTGAGIKT
jgi:hypothetical protein